MSTTVNVAHVQQYRANVFHLSQQKGSRLAMGVRNESQQGKRQFFDRLGSTEAVLKTSRHGDTPLVNSDHSRRACDLNDYEWADLVDKQDLIRMLMDPQSAYAQSAMWAMGRKKDYEILTAASGSAIAGENGGSSVVLPATQKLAAVADGAGAFLNVQTLIRAKSKFGQNDVDENIKLYIAVDQFQIDNLLNETEVTSSDYAKVKALQEGKVGEYMGFTFIRTQQIQLQASALNFNPDTGAVGSGAGDANGYRQCIAWAQDGLLLSIAKEMEASVDKRPDKSNATQVYVCMSIGAVRMEEEKVVQVLCKAS